MRSSGVTAMSRGPPRLRSGMDAFPAEFMADFAPSQSLPDQLPGDPLPIFKAWFDEAQAKKVQPNANAMTLATVDSDGRPSARVVLCRDIDTALGTVAFYTNYESRKGVAMSANPRAALVFWWDALDRQIRVEGRVTRCSEAESDAYFRKRPWESRLGAWASAQSRPLPSRELLLVQIVQTVERLGLSLPDLLERGDEVEIPRPPNWGGYRVWIERLELWLGGPGRLHDRAEWVRELRAAGEAFTAGPWSGTRLQP